MAFEHYMACHECSLFSTIPPLISHLSIATFNPSEISRAMISTNGDWSSSQKFGLWMKTLWTKGVSINENPNGVLHRHAVNTKPWSTGFCIKLFGSRSHTKPKDHETF